MILGPMAVTRLANPPPDSGIEGFLMTGSSYGNGMTMAFPGSGTLEIAGAGPVVHVRVGDDGRFRIRLEPGVYGIVAEASEYGGGEGQSFVTVRPHHFTGIRIFALESDP